MTIAVLLLKLEQASHNFLSKMDWESGHFSERLSGLLTRVSTVLSRWEDSNAANRYREALTAIREILARLTQSLRESAANSEYLALCKEVAKTNLKLLARRLSGLHPYVQKVVENRIALVYISLCIGFLGGRLWCGKSFPKLQPLHMMSVVCGSYSGPDGLALCQIEMPRPQYDDDILVRVMSAGLDRSDLLAVSGWGRIERSRPNAGFSIGRDFCGVVVEAGVEVTHLRPGDKVWGSVPDFHLPGTLSEHIVVRGRLAHRMPSNLNWEGAATVPYSALQVWAALVWRGGLRPDQATGIHVLVVDGVTDSGCLAVQLACLWGAHVTVLCPGRTVPLADALGAHVIVAARDDEVECVQDLLETGPFDLVVLAGDLLSQASATKLLSHGGRVTSTLPPPISSDSWGMVRRLFHPLWRSLVSPPYVPAIKKIGEPLSYVTSAVQSGKLQTVVDTVYSPQEVAGALTRLATQDSVGKSVVLFDRI